MSYNLTYLDTAMSLNNLLSDIVKYERERLTAITEATVRKQDHVRADRSEVSAFNHDIITTNEALILHLNAYQGDDALSTYLDLTPMAVQAGLSAMAMVRAAANSEADLALWQSYDDELGGDAMADLRILSSDLRTLDFYLYGKACELNEVTLVQSPNVYS